MFLFEKDLFKTGIKKNLKISKKVWYQKSYRERELKFIEKEKKFNIFRKVDKKIIQYDLNLKHK
jgi:hypothetical protein